MPSVWYLKMGSDLLLQIQTSDEQCMKFHDHFLFILVNYFKSGMSTISTFIKCASH